MERLFYPARRARGKAFDELAYYAEHFDTVEVNSTFYGQPRPEVTRGWADRTPSGFEFSVKLYQKFTHPRMFEDRLRRSVAGSPGADEQDELLTALARPNAGGPRRVQARGRSARRARETGRAAGAISPELQER